MTDTGSMPEDGTPVVAPTVAPASTPTISDTPGSGGWIVTGSGFMGEISYTPLSGGAEIRAKHGDTIQGSDLRAATLSWLVSLGKIEPVGTVHAAPAPAPVPEAVPESVPEPVEEPVEETPAPPVDTAPAQPDVVEGA